MRTIATAATNAPARRLHAAAAMAALAAAGCSPHVSHTPSGLDIRTVPFGPTVRIGGVDDDDTPVSVNVARRPGRPVVEVSGD